MVKQVGCVCRAWRHILSYSRHAMSGSQWEVAYSIKASASASHEDDSHERQVDRRLGSSFDSALQVQGPRLAFKVSVQPRAAAIVESWAGAYSGGLWCSSTSRTIHSPVQALATLLSTLTYHRILRHSLDDQSPGCLRTWSVEDGSERSVRCQCSTTSAEMKVQPASRRQESTTTCQLFAPPKSRTRVRQYAMPPIVSNR